MKNPEMEVVTEQLYDDGVYLLQRVAEHEPELAVEMEKLLARQGGCPAGDRIVNVDYRGNVHLCPYWQYRTIGNIREQKLSDICFDEENEILAMMKDKTQHLKGSAGGACINTFAGDAGPGQRRCAAISSGQILLAILRRRRLQRYDSYGILKNRPKLVLVYLLLV